MPLVTSTIFLNYRSSQDGSLQNEKIISYHFSPSVFFARLGKSNLSVSEQHTGIMQRKFKNSFKIKINSQLPGLNDSIHSCGNICLAAGMEIMFFCPR